MEKNVSSAAFVQIRVNIAKIVAEVKKGHVLIVSLARITMDQMSLVSIVLVAQ
jgi:hypothetical protein